MSYIRASSNPEGLYIFGGLSGGIEISTGRDWKLTNIGPYDGQDMVVPYADFVEACRQWQEGLEDNIQVGGFKIENQLVRMDGSPIGETTAEDFLAGFGKKYQGSFAGVRLSYGKLYCQLYHATWGYVVANVLRQEGITV